MAKFIAIPGVVIGVLAILFAFMILSTVIIFFGWNLGVVALVAACGGAVSKIGFWTAFFVSLALTAVKSLFTSAA